MATLNRIQIIGHVGKDPEIKFLPNGNTVANFSVATTEKKNDEERTEWHNLVVFGKLAEICQDYVRKGSLVYVEGSLRTNKWEKDGKQYSRTEIIVNNIQFLDRKAKDGQKNNRPDDEDIPF